jgi:hypothetical protein
MKSKKASKKSKKKFKHFRAFAKLWDSGKSAALELESKTIFFLSTYHKLQESL